MKDFHARLTGADIDEINAYVKANPPDAATKREIAAMTGRHIRTVERWFSTGATGTRLIPVAFNGVQPMRAPLDVEREGAQRIIAGVLLEGGAVGDVFTGREKTLTGTRATFGGAVDELMTLAEGTFTRLALKEFEVTQIGGGWEWHYTYSQPDGDEYPDDSYDLPWGDDIEDEFFPDAPEFGELFADE